MSNSYYNHASYPTPNSPGSSAQLRAELESITAGFALLPTLAANGYKVAMINSAGTAMVASAALQSLAITSSTINSTPIGASAAAAGTFTSLTVTGTASLGTTTVITGGTINGTPIGGATPSSGAFTTVSASSGFTGALSGNVSGNVTGNVTGNVAGDLTGDVASSGTSTFAAITMSGAIAMGTGKITGLGEPTNAQDGATKNYTDTGLALQLSLTGGTMSGAIAMGTSKITGVGDPTAAQDVATKAYVDTLSQGLDAKGSCRVATTANITLSGAQTIDAIAVIAGNRVLVKDQTAPADNGIYVCASGAWTRALDADDWAELPAAFVFIEVGTANANSGYVCTVAAGGTLGVTAITWTQFSGAGQITAGLGLTKSANTIDVGTASAARIVVNADNIDLATTSVSAGTYQSMTVDTYGRVTAGSNPTTLAGYSITDAYTQTQVNNALALKLNLTGGTMSGAIAMGASKITGMADPTNAQDATTKFYVDAIMGSATSAETSASNAAVSETNASNSATASATSATESANSAASSLSSLNTFIGQYYGALSADPTLDPLGNAMTTGDLYFNTTGAQMKAFNGTDWVVTYLPASAAFADRGTGVTSTYVSTVAVGGTTFSQPALTGEINSDEGFFSVTYAGATNVTVANLTVASTYIYIDKTGALQQQAATPSRQDWTRNIYTMRIAVDVNTNLILAFEYLNNPIGHYANSMRDIYSYLLAQGVPFKKGQPITGRSADLGFDVGAGTLMEFGGTGDIYNANILSFDAVSNVSYGLLSRTAFVSQETNLVKFWDNNGTITALGSTTVVGHRLYRFSNGNFAIQYGQANYANMTLAKAGAVLEDFEPNPVLVNSTFFGWWFIQSTATNTGGTTLTDFTQYTLGIQGGSSGALGSAVLKGNNGSDFTDVPQVLVNLGNRTSATGSEILPAGTTAQRDGSPGAGYLRWNTTESTAEIYTGSAWGSVGGGATGGGSDAVFYENGQTVTTSYALTAGNNAMSTGPITVNSGVAVTVPSGSRWAII